MADARSLQSVESAYLQKKLSDIYSKLITLKTTELKKTYRALSTESIQQKRQKLLEIKTKDKEQAATKKRAIFFNNFSTAVKNLINAIIDLEKHLRTNMESEKKGAQEFLKKWQEIAPIDRGSYTAEISAKICLLEEWLQTAIQQLDSSNIDFFNYELNPLFQFKVRHEELTKIVFQFDEKEKEIRDKYENPISTWGDEIERLSKKLQLVSSDADIELIKNDLSNAKAQRMQQIRRSGAEIKEIYQAFDLAKSELIQRIEMKADQPSFFDQLKLKFATENSENKSPSKKVQRTNSDFKLSSNPSMLERRTFSTQSFFRDKTEIKKTEANESPVKSKGLG